jgi:serine phosphatase RsbU (regulator of sigma subunit)
MVGTRVTSTPAVTATRSESPAATGADLSAPPGRPPSGPDVRARQATRPRRVAASIALVGIALTASSAFGAARIDHNTEQRLLDGQTRQAATVLSTAITVIQQPLEGALAVQRAASGMGDREVFEQFMKPHIGKDKTFQTSSLWVRRDGSLDRVETVGAPPAMAPGDAETLAHLERAYDSKTTTVKFLNVGDRTRIIYVRADPATGWLVYAERSVPANRRAQVDNDSAFSDIHYAIYLGDKVRSEGLTTTDVDPDSLPFDGTTSREEVPFGDNVITLTTTPRDHMGGDLGRRLPWILLVLGLALTAIAAGAGRQLARGRQTAEQDAATITALYEQTEALYDQQRDLFVNLQRALLPHVNPEIRNVELATEYVAGARGLDIGGDWYSIVALDGTRFGFVVGDVSGRGIESVAMMAQARFTSRAYLLDGDAPSVILDKCAPQFDITRDKHMATVLVGVGDWRTGEVTLASAGHPPPVLVTEAGASFVGLTPGRPLGTGIAPYPSVTVQMPPGSTLFCFTDGLVERRGEDIDVGLDRLARALEEASQRPVGELVEHALDRLRNDDAPDDIATLALRWTGDR